MAKKQTNAAPQVAGASEQKFIPTGKKFFTHVAYKAGDGKGNQIDGDCCVCIPEGIDFNMMSLRQLATQQLKQMAPDIDWGPATITSLTEISEGLFKQLNPDAVQE